MISQRHGWSCSAYATSVSHIMPVAQPPTLITTSADVRCDAVTGVWTLQLPDGVLYPEARVKKRPRAESPSHALAGGPLSRG